jgi:Family of unknown function (DUF5309)
MISGQRGPEQLNSVRVKPDVSETILFYVPEATPLLTLTGLMRDKRMATQRQFQWLERDEYPRVTVSSTAYDDDDVSIVVATGTGSRFAVPYLIQNLATDEIMRVTAISTDTLTVTRGIGGTAAPIAIGDKLLFLASAFEDGADLGTLKTIQDFNLYNYTQIIRTPFGFTGRDLETELFGGRDEKTETKAATIEHKKSIEQVMYFGKRSLATATHEITTTGGLKYFISTNAWNVSGTPLNKRTFDEFLEEGMKWGLGGNQSKGSGLKYLLCSSRWLTEINSFANPGLRYETLDETIGLAATAYISPHGKVRMMHSPLLDRNHKDHAFLVDPNHLRYVYHRGRDTSLLRDRQLPGIDGESSEYLSDVGIEVSFEHAHAILTGVSV